MKEKIILIGGGGHARVMIELLRVSGEYEIAGILDPRLEEGDMVDDVPVLGDDTLLPGLRVSGIKNASIAVGNVKDNSVRKGLFKLAKDSGFYLPYFIHPRSIVLESGTNISEGVQIMAGAIVHIGSTVGENTIINTGAIIEHDCTIGKNVHICPGAVVCGGSTVGDNSFIGAGATVIHLMEIGEGAIVGAGSVVKKNVADGALLKGSMG
jgi:UDP-perosamine 4-acetyltransferase